MAKASVADTDAFTHGGISSMPRKYNIPTCDHTKKKSSRTCWDCYKKHIQSRICSIPDCGRKHAARGWCNRHYKRWLQYGDPLAPIRLVRHHGTPEERFWARVDSSGDCWLWTGAASDAGYGIFNNGERVIHAHRQAYIFEHGEIPDGLSLDHLCQITLCVRPAHLEAVTQKENNRRAAASRGTCQRGHPWTDENIYRRPDTKLRVCRACAKLRKRGGHKRRPSLSEVRQRVLARDRGRCAYCDNVALTIDHIVPRDERRRIGIEDDDEAWIVACCKADNIRKGTRRLIPPSLAHLKDELEERTGRPWLVWSGDPKELREVLR